MLCYSLKESLCRYTSEMFTGIHKVVVCLLVLYSEYSARRDPELDQQHFIIDVLLIACSLLHKFLYSYHIIIQEEWISMLLSGGSPATSLAVLYRFQTVTETLKTIRKNLVVDTDRTQHHSLQGDYCGSRRQ